MSGAIFEGHRIGYKPRTREADFSALFRFSPLPPAGLQATETGETA